MDIFTLYKIIAAIITIVIAFIAGFIELRLNPDYWLNRWFAMFFISASLGFLAYTIYHLITFNRHLVIPIMITAHILLSFGFICLVMTVFILEVGEERAMTIKYLGPIMILFAILSLGYFIWVPTLNMEQYEKGIVDTESVFGWFIFVNLIRIILFIFVLYKYAVIAKKLEGASKKRVTWFFGGSVIVLVGMALNLIGGLLYIVLIEISSLIFISAGSLIILKGFLIKVE